MVRPGKTGAADTEHANSGGPGEAFGLPKSILGEEKRGLRVNIQPDSDSQDDIDAAALAATFELAQQSPDPSTKVGALFLAADSTTVLGTGFNRFPPGLARSAADYADRAYKYKHIIHAEEWALRDVVSRYAPGELRHLLRGGTLYTSFNCCSRCARAVRGLGLKRVVFPPLNEAGRTREWVEQWRAERNAALEVLERDGITVSIRHV